MEFKANFNKIHFDLSEIFKDISVSEKFNNKLGNYIEISIKENVECRLIIKKSDLESTRFNWFYLSNPLNEKIGTIERSSTIETFTQDIKDVIDNKRFDTDYILKVK